MNPKNSAMVQAILAAVRRQNPKVKAAHREDIPSDLLARIKAEAIREERLRAMAPSLLAKAFQALR